MSVVPTPRRASAISTVESGNVPVAGEAKLGSKQRRPESSASPTVVEESAVNDKEDCVTEHIRLVAEHIREATLQREEGDEWLKSVGSPPSIEAHVAAIVHASGCADLDGRLRQLGRARERHQFLQQVSKKKNRDRVRQAAGKHGVKMTHCEAAAGVVDSSSAVPLSSSVASRGDGTSGDGANRNQSKDTAGDGPIGVVNKASVGNSSGGFTKSRATSKGSSSSKGSEAKSFQWSKVESFNTQDEALRFVLKCQPFDFHPVMPTGEEPFPRFDNSSEALAFATEMETPPSEFVRCIAESGRRLRIRFQEEPETQSALKSTFRKVNDRPPSVRPRQSVLGAVDAFFASVPPPKSLKEWRPWIVEGTGGLFQRAASLRDLKDASGFSRYYIAINQELERRVLIEGFRVKRRSSIPCSATVQGAIDAFKNKQTPTDLPLVSSVLSSQEPAWSVLTVNVPPHVEVVPNKSGGFCILAKELPPSCLKARQRTDNA
eukprot:TRINITY_DN54958_c0_g1_i1.p1 TRINITY_DN54958_c0_g1~~TRINITY_DN54958_c0_g1_i1.p1  ORF type:complete len:490 (+),score=105.16 TRINITY_DN54958_c0_g1_i1:177-1646(+)